MQLIKFIKSLMEVRRLKTSSGKAKGRKFQQFVRDMMLIKAPNLTDDDIRSTSMGASGPDILLSTAAKSVYPWAIEVKCQERLNVWRAWEQTVSHIESDTEMPVLFIKKNRSTALVVMTADDFFSERSRVGQKLSGNGVK